MRKSDIAVISQTNVTELFSRGEQCLPSLSGQFNSCSAVLSRNRDTPIGAAVGSRIANNFEGVRTAPAGHNARESGEKDRGLHRAATRVATTHPAIARPVPAQEV